MGQGGRMPAATPEKIPDMLNLLNLNQTAVVEGPEQYRVHVTANYMSNPECVCPLPKVVKNGTKEVLFMDTPMHGKKVGILVARQRFLCQGCRSTLYPDVPYMHEKHQMTNRLVAYIQRYGTERTFSAIANEIGITSQTVSDIWNAYAREQLAKLAPVTPEWLGIGADDAPANDILEKAIERDVGSFEDDQPAEGREILRVHFRLP